MTKVAGFFKKNIVVIVMVPALVGAHYGWYKLQHVDSLVSQEERNKLPITKVISDISS